jgi:phage-related protein
VPSISVQTDTKQAENKLLPFFKKIEKAMEPLIKVTKKWVEGLDFKGLTNGLKLLLEPLKEFGAFAQEVLFWVYTNVFLPLSTWSINEFAPVVVDSLKQAFEGLNSVIQSLWEGLQVLFEELEPMITWIGDTAIWIVEELGDVFSDVGDVFQEKGDKIKQIFADIGSVVQIMWEIIQPIFDGMKELIQIVFDAIEPIVGDLIDVFSGLAAFISGVFTGDWEKAWNGVVDVFKGIVNILIDGLNIFIRGLNLIQFDLPDWDVLGSWAGKTLGIDIPEIPHLAQGAVVPPNREFMAVLGDNKKEVEIVSPLSTMKQAVAEVLAQANIGGGFNGTIEVPVIIDGREIARAVREAESNMGSQTVFGGFANVY